MHLSDMSTDTLINRAERYVSRDIPIPADLHFELIERGIDASAIEAGEDSSTAGLVQHSMD